MPSAEPASVSAPVVASSSEMEPFDYLLFRTEADPHARSSAVGVELLDRAPDWDRLVDAFDRASRAAVRMRQKVVVPTVPWALPRWVVDPDFDLFYHVRRIAVAPPGTLRQVLDLAIIMAEAPLDTARPLWEITLVEGLDNGRAALLSKLSHAVADGLGALKMAEQTYEAERDPPPRQLLPMPIPEDITGQDLTLKAVRRLPLSAIETAARGGLGMARAAGRSVRAPVRTASEVTAFIRSLRRMVAPPPVEPSPLLRRRSLTSRLAVLDVPLSALRRAGKAVGCSVNDAYLAAVCGALRRYHDALGVPVEAVPMAIPISLRSTDDPAGGNRWSGARMRAPVGEEDPRERMRLIRELVASARAEPAIGALDLLAPIIGRLPASMLGSLNAFTSSIDVQASNVPGDSDPRYVAGGRVEATYVAGPLPGVAMMVILYSQAGTARISVRYDRASVTESDLFERCLREGFDEVVAVGEHPVATRGDGGAATAAAATEQTATATAPLAPGGAKKAT